MESWLLWVTLVQISGCTLHFNSPFSHNNRMTREHLHYYHMSVSKRKKKRPYKELPYVSTYFTLSYHNWGRLTHLLLDFGVSGDSDCKKKKLGGEVAAFSIFTLELLAIDLSNRLITLIEMGVCGLVVLWHGNTILVPSCFFFFLMMILDVLISFKIIMILVHCRSPQRSYTYQTSYWFTAFTSLLISEVSNLPDSYVLLQRHSYLIKPVMTFLSTLFDIRLFSFFPFKLKRPKLINLFRFLVQNMHYQTQLVLSFQSESPHVQTLTTIPFQLAPPTDAEFLSTLDIRLFHFSFPSSWNGAFNLFIFLVQKHFFIKLSLSCHSSHHTSNPQSYIS